jgi:hypothetical protein
MKKKRNRRANVSDYGYIILAKETDFGVYFLISQWMM